MLIGFVRHRASVNWTQRWKNTGGSTRKDDRKVETSVTRWLTSQGTDWCQMGTESPSNDL